MGKKKKFINKKNAVSFHLVHRSQRDPMQAADDAPAHVLLPVQPLSEEEAAAARKAEQRKFGVFYDDDYDYMQHLRDVSELHDVGPEAGPAAWKKSDVTSETHGDAGKEEKGPTLQLPSTVFGSTAETDVGLLNKAAPLAGPQLDWDPDIVAALDDDFDHEDPENCLEDDFMTQANAEPDESEESMAALNDSHFKRERMEEYFQSQSKYYKCNSEEEDDSEEEEEEEDVSDLDSLGDMMSFSGQETKSHFTEYSMSSSVIRRNEGLTLLDARFEKMYEQYQDEEIGALDHEDIDGTIQEGNRVLDAALEEFEQQQNAQTLKDIVQKAADVEIASGSDASDREDLVKLEWKEPDKKWDCESILSTYSTLYNHPQTIREPKKVQPVKLSHRGKVLQEGLTHKELEEQERKRRQATKADRASTYRPHRETAEERRQRKKSVKEERKARREEKKCNKQAFKAEEIRQHKEKMNLNTNLQGAKIV